MTHHSIPTPKTTNLKLVWKKTIVGQDAIVYEKKLDPSIIDLMPNEIDTFIDVNLVRLSYIRFRQRLSKLLQPSRLN